MARTLSASAHKKAIAAAISLVAERGIDATSMDAIAQKSGVSKATLYKHWIDKDSLMLDVLAELNGLHSRPLFDSGDTKADLISVLAYKPERNAKTRDKIMPHFIAYSARHQEFGYAWRSTVLEPPRKDLKRLLTQAIERRQLSGIVDLEQAIALLLGPMVYWFVFLQRTGTPLRDLAEKVVDSFWRAWAVEKGAVKRAAKNRPST